MSISRALSWFILVALMVGLAIDRSIAQQPVPDNRTAAEVLAAEFVQPPDSARPWVYWFWLNGNITREGITADLEAMKRVGIGGALIMEVDQGAPVGPVDFMSKDWRNLFQHVQQEAQRLGLEVNMNNDAGWNGSGGPWITPAQAMQKVVWSETEVEGPQQFASTLPQPETVAGFYRDICVMAFPKTGDYRIERIRAKAMFEVGGVGGIARDTLPGKHADRPPESRDVDRADEQRGAPGVGSPGWNMDDRAFRPHLYGRRECTGTGERAWPRMRQTQQGGHRRQFRRHDGQAGGGHRCRTGLSPRRAWWPHTSTVGKTAPRTGPRPCARNSSAGAVTTCCRSCRC